MTPSSATPSQSRSFVTSTTASSQQTIAPSSLVSSQRSDLTTVSSFTPSRPSISQQLSSQSFPISTTSTPSSPGPSASSINVALPSSSPSASQCRLHIIETRFSTRRNVWNVAVYTKAGRDLTDKSPICMTGTDAPETH